MMIRINYLDGRFDMVKTSCLDDLIEAKQICSFQRNSGWVMLGYDPVRRKLPTAYYIGPDRRDLHAQQVTVACG